MWLILSRVTISAVAVTELLTRAPQVSAGDPVLMPGNFFHVVKRMTAHV